ncbi:MAG: helix-turn-helix domain-containing protein [Pirellulaceae bacterium]|jgi:excisionase family DNA binding protein
MEQILVSSRDAAKMLGISERTLWSLKTQGSIPSVKTGKSVRYRPETLRRWAEEKEQDGARKTYTIISENLGETTNGQH